MKEISLQFADICMYSDVMYYEAHDNTYEVFLPQMWNLILI